MPTTSHFFLFCFLILVPLAQMSIMNSVALFSASCVLALIRSRKSDNKSFSFTSSSSNSKTLTVSTPGKVLVAGGYLILERPHVGISIAVTSRFHSTISSCKSESIDFNDKNILLVKIKCPQFNVVYLYSYNIAKNLLFQLSEETNPFIESCIADTLSFILYHEQTKKGLAAAQSPGSLPWSYLQITLQADNDFYSQIDLLQKLHLPLYSSSLLTLPQFSIPEPGNINKTGLGSSAALVSSLVASLLCFFNVVTLTNNNSHNTSCKSSKSATNDFRPLFNEEDCRIIHNLAQVVHCKAQGKIGSGFDVATSIYGRFVSLFRCFLRFSFLLLFVHS
jgi:phosphomevalonate kinase